MKAIYDEFFAVPETGKVKEKVLLTRIALLVLTTLLGLAAMSFSAYAYYSYSVSSRAAEINAARFDVKIFLTDAEGNEVAVQKPETNVYRATLPAGTVLVRMENAGTATMGFCTMTVKDCEETYHIQQMTEAVKEATFRIELSAPSVVTFQCNWGTSSCHSTYVQTGTNTDQYVLDKDTVTPVLKLPAPQPPVEEETTETTEDTSSETTEETTQATQSNSVATTEGETNEA